MFNFDEMPCKTYKHSKGRDLQTGFPKGRHLLPTQLMAVSPQDPYLLCSCPCGILFNNESRLIHVTHRAWWR